MNIIGYILSIALIVIFALYCSGRVGFYILYILLLAPLISFAMTRLISRFIKIDIDADSILLEKGNVANLKINITNNSFIPTPLIAIKMLDSSNFELEFDSLNLFLFPKERRSFEVKLKAKLCGGSYIGIENVCLKGYFGLYKRKIISESLRMKLGIIPEIIDINYLEDFVKTSSDLSYSDDNSEETSDESSLNFAGFPGYEYREYIPGDPVKRINFKLSAKRDILMVRLDERMTLSKISMIIDPFSNYVGDNAAFVYSHALEVAVSLIDTLVSRDYEVDLSVRLNDGWYQKNIIFGEEMVEIARLLSDYMFEEIGITHNAADRFDAAHSYASSIIYITPRATDYLYSELSKLKSNDKGLVNIYEASFEKGGQL